MMDFDPLIDAIVADYSRWTFASVDRFEKETGLNADAGRKAARDRVNDFRAKLTTHDGQKYVKVISDNSVWGFIVKAGDPAFAEGDILKAADWSRPARNEARGNIITGDLSKVRWTGPEYLK